MTNRTVSAVGLILVTVAAPLHASDVDVSKLPPAARREGVTYANDIQPIFQGTCFGCHGPRRQRGGLRLDSLSTVLKGGKDGKVVQPGESEKSVLVIAVAQLDPKTAMPPKPRHVGPGGPGGGPGGPGPDGGPPPPPHDGGTNQSPRGPMGPPPKALTPEQVGLVRAWIDQGAK